jgi:aryl carrier-like protein
MNNSLELIALWRLADHGARSKAIVQQSAMPFALAELIRVMRWLHSLRNFDIDITFLMTSHTSTSVVDRPQLLSDTV